ncbi:MAG TPA: efflux RND transporter periplasmic adaptor subunit [Pyrinomonadaceae bacterium]|nr:efflux RND transporter periplasmic adaptor subunit [Pyrinomonadaceae bacterium]HMP64080.1 efflux RND transporter periplasmic adaptor subunit [Pyrinomonadaceae bacterium]
MEENTSPTGEIEKIDAESAMQARKQKMVIVAIGAGVASVAVVALLVWYFTRSGDAGRPVPAPTMSMSDTSDSRGNQFVDQTITLSATEVENAGLAIETVGEQLATESETVAATGVVEANAYKQTPAVSLVGGIVRRGLPELGESVRAGQTIAVIFSDEFAQTQSRYIALRTEVENARRNYERSLRLVEINQPGRGEVEQAARQRKAAEAAVAEFRNRYDRTTRLIRIGAASREELEQDTTKLRTAEAELEEARQREARAQRLLPISPEVRAASEESLNKLRTAETELASTRQRLILYGMPSARLDSLRSASQISSELLVPAPISGTVTSRAVNAGEVVDASKELLRITDLSSVWVIAQVFERDVARLRVGSGASVTSDAFPDNIFRGQITYIDPQFDNATRTGKVRIELANPGQALKIGMYVKAAFGALGDAERTSPVIPAAAVQRIGDQDVVFVPTEDPVVFALRSVRLGPEVDGRRIVQEGLQVGDRVVTNGSFLLRAAWLKAR